MLVDNLDLANRRVRLGLSQQDVADILCGFDPTDPEQAGKGFNFSNVSRFENGKPDRTLPPRNRGEARITRADVEALYDRLEAERKAVA